MTAAQLEYSRNDTYEECHEKGKRAAAAGVLRAHAPLKYTKKQQTAWRWGWDHAVHVDGVKPPNPTPWRTSK